MQNERVSISRQLVDICTEYLKTVHQRASNVGRHDVEGKRQLCHTLLTAARNHLRAQRYGDGFQEEEEMLTALDNALDWLDSSDHWETALRDRLQTLSDKANKAIITVQATRMRP